MRVKSPRRQRHNKVLKLAKGYRMARSKHYKAAHEAVLHAGQYAFAGRRLRRRDKRSEWIVQMNAALMQLSLETDEPKIAYSRLINAMKTKNVVLDRKIMSTIAKEDFPTFKHLVQQVMS